MEKIHGTSTHIRYTKVETTEGIHEEVNFFSGGEKHERFIILFNEEKLIEVFRELGANEVVVYGEAYGGSQQGMSHTYGKELKFIVFDVKIDGMWLEVPNAEQVAKNLGLEFVYYERIPADIEKINFCRDWCSVQAERNGLGKDKMQEGIVLRPLVELIKKNGGRVIAKHKRDEFKETKTAREVNPEELRVLTEAKAIAEEWVTDMRLTHVLDKLNGTFLSVSLFPQDGSTPFVLGIEQTPDVIRAMLEDIRLEAEGEIVWSKEVDKSVSKLTAQKYKQRIQNSIIL